MTSLKTWMADLPPEIAEQPLRLLKIPGSHDSGATPELNPKLPMAPDVPGSVKRLGKVCFVKPGVKRWGVCQRYSIREQLEHGVRYLDLRVAYPPPKVRTSVTDFRLVHGLYGMTLEQCLSQVVDFLKENEKEVVLIDINHLYGIDGSGLTILAKEVVSVLGENGLCHRLCPYTKDFSTITLNEIWNSDYRVIVIFPSEQRISPLLWPSSSILSPWPDTSNMDVLIKNLQHDLESRSEKSKEFFVSQGVLTPQGKDVVGSWCSSLQKFSENTSPRVMQWISELSEENKKKINIVILNFIDDHTSSFIISLNKTSAQKSVPTSGREASNKTDLNAILHSEPTQPSA